MSSWEDLGNHMSHRKRNEYEGKLDVLLTSQYQSWIYGLDESLGRYTMPAKQCSEYNIP